MKKQFYIVVLSIIVFFAFLSLTDKKKIEIDSNQEYFKMIKEISLDNIEEIQIINEQQQNRSIKVVNENENKKKVLELINSLNLENLEGNKSDFERENALYQIRIIEKNYYPQGSIYIFPYSIWYKGKSYYLTTDIGSKFQKIYYKIDTK
ncbi:hypothetical protein [Caloranaerobacter ferrireducens]|uniref:hypothetical protein n=1 Tax=Caloranaerobacter ferrireducens TaxID=1323370 RepID=UPI00084DAECA|nr:hypothetical protein [Caloranaerobacter ferrireducens]